MPDSTICAVIGSFKCFKYINNLISSGLLAITGKFDNLSAFALGLCCVDVIAAKILPLCGRQAIVV